MTTTTEPQAEPQAEAAPKKRAPRKTAAKAAAPAKATKRAPRKQASKGGVKDPAVGAKAEADVVVTEPEQVTVVEVKQRPWTLAEARQQVRDGYTLTAVVARTGFSENQIKFGVRASAADS